MNAAVFIYRGIDICIATDISDSIVNQDTLQHSACKDLFGPSAALISLPKNETDLWNYVLTRVNR